jgi:signal transduction histidine kinase
VTGSVAIAGWPAAGLLLALLVDCRVRARRRRVELNRALHELRRPLQQLALSAYHAPGRGSPSPLQLALAAVSQLDREINGAQRETRLLVSARELAGGAVGRWSSAARHGGGSLELRWRAGRAPVLGDPIRISQALDNLIVNALEHGGRNLVVEARSAAGRLRISVADDGRGDLRQPRERRATGGEAVNGGGRGHGLEIVRSVAASHEGRFVLKKSATGSVAVLELPLVAAGDALAA